MALVDVLPNAPTTSDDALALFDASSAVEPGFMIGTWRGAELPTGHRLDGLLEASGWWGKQFVDSETTGSANVSAAHIEKAQERIAEAAAGIRAAHFPPKPAFNTCRNCPYGLHGICRHSATHAGR